MEQQMLLPLDHETSLNYMARAMADQDVESGACLNWDHAYEDAWSYLEGEMSNDCN